MQFNKFARAGALVSGLALSAGAAMAQSTGATDVTAAITEISNAKSNVLQIGLAVFGVAVGVKLYKWLKSAL
ncbi:major capsid protein [Aquabacterium sp.]|uniref:major capsid protein n=1 Tax=Aquabacterium sp. TaxID=1872578 RepID=UPI0025C6D2CE|nr:major capsid protein [Aquabacterium sp.]